MKKAEVYEKPTIIGPIQCLRGTNGFRWSTDPVYSTLDLAGLKKKVLNLNLREEEWGGNIVNLNDDQVFETNRTGFQIIQQLREDVKLGDLAEKMNKQYGVDPEELAVDISEFALNAYRLLK